MRCEWQVTLEQSQKKVVEDYLASHRLRKHTHTIVIARKITLCNNGIHLHCTFQKAKTIKGVQDIIILPDGTLQTQEEE